MGKSRRLSHGASVEESTFAENDDEAERNALFAARAAEAERAKVVKSPGKKAAGRDAAGDGGEGGPASSWGEIAGIYADCIKLCNDNVRCAGAHSKECCEAYPPCARTLSRSRACALVRRRPAAPSRAPRAAFRGPQKVNEKNSWSLNLIDHMGDVLSKPGSDAAAADDGDTNFQMASCTLDAGVKIYGYRVDSVYSAAFRVLGGLNRTGAAPGDGARSSSDARLAPGRAPRPAARQRSRGRTCARPSSVRPSARRASHLPPTAPSRPRANLPARRRRRGGRR
jgi:hypothetical protein